jgi:hypothetical protein
MEERGLEEVLDAYVAAWNEPDPEARRRLLERSLADGCTFEGPTGRFVGRDAIDRFIGALQGRMPGARVERVGPADGEAFSWRICTADGRMLLAGHDLVEVDGDGRLRSIGVRATPRQ